MHCLKFAVTVSHYPMVRLSVYGGAGRAGNTVQQSAVLQTMHYRQGVACAAYMEGARPIPQHSSIAYMLRVRNGKTELRGQS